MECKTYLLPNLIIFIVYSTFAFGGAERIAELEDLFLNGEKTNPQYDAIDVEVIDTPFFNCEEVYEVVLLDSSFTLPPREWIVYFESGAVKSLVPARELDIYNINNKDTHISILNEILMRKHKLCALAQLEKKWYEQHVLSLV